MSPEIRPVVGVQNLSGQLVVDEWNDDGSRRFDKGIDQLQGVVDSIRNDPFGRRHIISAWNPKELNDTALPPCHCFVQFYVNDGRLSCQFYMRSCDLFLGFPLNLLSYSILTSLVADATGLSPGEVIFTGGDVHIYNNHMKQVNLQIEREPYPFPKLLVKRTVQSIKDMEALTFDDFEFLNYKHHPVIKAEMAV